MLADHHYSSLGVGHDGKPVAERQRFVQRDQGVFANTLCPGVMNQSLLEHLLGVGHTASLIAHALPNFERQLRKQREDYPAIGNGSLPRRQLRNQRHRVSRQAAQKGFDE